MYICPIWSVKAVFEGAAECIVYINSKIIYAENIVHTYILGFLVQVDPEIISRELPDVLV